MRRTKSYLFLFLIIVPLLPLTFCRQGEKPLTGNESLQNSKADTSLTTGSAVNKKIGAWVQKGVECFGIVIVNFNDGRTIGKAVKCKVMTLKPDQVKMKTIESVSLMESQGCDKLGLAYGDTWWEKEGDIFRTREEAENFLKEKGWFIN